MKAPKITQRETSELKRALKPNCFGNNFTAPSGAGDKDNGPRRITHALLACVWMKKLRKRKPAVTVVHILK